MSNPFAARQKPEPNSDDAPGSLRRGGNAPTNAPGAPDRRSPSERPTIVREGRDPVISRANDPEPIEAAQDMQAPIGGTSAAVPDSATAPDPAGAEPAAASSTPNPDAGAPASGDDRPELPPRARLDDLRKGELVDLARRRRVETESGDTRATIIDKLERDAGRTP